MPRMRQALALAVLFGIGAFVYLWLGLPGFVGFGFGITASVLTVGISVGYWIGDGDSDVLVTKLMECGKKRSLGE